MSCTSHVVLKVVVKIVSSECDAYPIRCLRPLALLNITNITPMTVSVSQQLNILCIMFKIREFFTTTLFRPSISQGLDTIFPPSTLKTTREESKMSNFHTTLFQNGFVLVS